MKKQYEVTLNLKFNGITETDILYTSGDAETMPLYITLLGEDGAPIEPPPGATGRLFFKVGTYTWPQDAQFQPDGTLLYEIKPEDIAIPGPVSVRVAVISGQKRLTWQGFTFNVAENPSGGVPEPTETRFFLGTPPAEPGVSYIITALGIIEADKVIM